MTPGFALLALAAILVWIALIVWLASWIILRLRGRFPALRGLDPRTGLVDNMQTNQLWK